jgi:small-conductance mechanosensitive channel
MKQVLSKEEVAKAMGDMTSQGKRVTLNSLHAALNHRGSMTTLMRLKSELEIAAQPMGAVDSPEGLKTFREVWALAVDEGRKQQEAVISQLREDQKALAAENERLDGLATGAEARARDLEQAKSASDADLVEVRARLEQELKGVQATLLDATDQAKQALAKLTAEQAAHAEEVSALRRELISEVGKSHEMELELVRAKAHLEARGAAGTSTGGARARAA